MGSASGTGCTFCDVISGTGTAVVVRENEHLISFLDHRPVFRGHTLLVPKLHVQLLSDVVSQSVPHLHLHVIPRRRKDGLRFWLGPRHPYDSDHPAEEYADRIRNALPAEHKNSATRRVAPPVG